MDNKELAARLDEIALRLEAIGPSGLDQPARYTQLDRIEHMLRWLCDQSINPPPPIRPSSMEPKANPTWPWSAATTNQGFLASKFERRDGTVYGASATQADSHVNSAIQGGDDGQAKVDVQSGEPRSGGGERARGSQARPDNQGPARAPARPR